MKLLKDPVQIFVVMLAAIISMTALSCKKGEDDPAFTLLTRKARVSGSWKMTNGKVTLGVSDAKTVYSDYLFIFTQNNYTLNIPGNGAHFEGPAELNITFTKEGTVKWNQVLDSLSLDAGGEWDFIGRSPDHRSKETIYIKATELNGYSQILELFNKALSRFSYQIKELRSKKMVLVCDKELINTTSKGYRYHITAEYTLEQ
jgi:hypothetical protein